MFVCVSVWALCQYMVLVGTGYIHCVYVYAMYAVQVCVHICVCLECICTRCYVQA